MRELNLLVDNSIKSYITAVEMLAKTQSSFLFDNSSHLHAAIVVTTMLKYSNIDVCIYDDDLSGDIADKYEPFYSELSSFFERGKTLKILIEKNNFKETRIYETLYNLKSKYPNYLFVRQANDSFSSEIKNVYNSPINFAVSDSKAYRIEKIEVPKTEKRSAFCCFNEKRVAEQLKRIFEIHFSNCTSLI